MAHCHPFAAYNVADRLLHLRGRPQTSPLRLHAHRQPSIFRARVFYLRTIDSGYYATMDPRKLLLPTHYNLVPARAVKLPKHVSQCFNIYNTAPACAAAPAPAQLTVSAGVQTPTHMDDTTTMASLQLHCRIRLDSKERRQPKLQRRGQPTPQLVRMTPRRTRAATLPDTP
ncbi:hypothetical protein PLICRDRAFT_180313 [Plicaturopsis crispa FD-325 SS-3]|uniref:Uncharacterized protein n=1 Tax=Plicaturopsis crispa FD-325 SS-3 TaxID=944288 RepID=A0A0C9SQA9_PLICR|nr:hypothetical protein PLICRDRAFT_180313 [Plicaturopsis crispa FD-325 SS-3]